jgi:hypothetical protein
MGEEVVEPGSTQTTEEPGDLRSAIESAVSEHSEPETKPTEQVEEKTESTEQPTEEVTEQPTEEKTESAPPQESQQQAQSLHQGVDKPPQSWKPGVKAKWASVDHEVRAEVHRREREVTRVLNESAQARNIVGQVTEAIRPYEARMRAVGLGPVEAIQRLFQADYLLTTSSPGKAAEYMATLIKEYGIDIKALDNALAGQPTADPIQTQIEQAVQQRLAPIGQFLQHQQAQQQAADYHRGQAALSEIETMAQDTTKYPHFEQVRETMADLIDFYAAKGQFETLESVYRKSVALNPELGAQSAKQIVRGQAAAVNQQAQRALAASVSVAGSPGGSPVSGRANGSIRDAVEAAWAAHSGR